MSNIIDTLIYDRTEADVVRVATLREKALTQGWDALTAEEKPSGPRVCAGRITPLT